jgi:hypothetical protein
MDWLNEAPVWPIVAPLLLWIKILEICAVVLIALALLTLLVGWLRHLSWRIRLSALVPLAASVGAAIAAHAFHDTYVFWVNYLNFWYNHRAPYAIFSHASYVIGNTTHAATVLGWVALVVTGILLALGLVGIWRLRGKAVPDSRRLPLFGSRL